MVRDLIDMVPAFIHVAVIEPTEAIISDIACAHPLRVLGRSPTMSAPGSGLGPEDPSLLPEQCVAPSAIGAAVLLPPSMRRPERSRSREGSTGSGGGEGRTVFPNAGHGIGERVKLGMGRGEPSSSQPPASGARSSIDIAGGGAPMAAAADGIGGAGDVVFPDGRRPMWQMMGPDHSFWLTFGRPASAGLRAPMPWRLDWHDGGYGDMAQELELQHGMIPLAAESFCKLMRDAGRPASDAVMPPTMLPFMLEGKKCWRVRLDNMKMPAALSPAALGMCLPTFSLRMFPWTQPSLACQILATGKLSGQFPDDGPGIYGRGFLEQSGSCEADQLQTALQLTSHAGEIIFEASVNQRHYSRLSGPRSVTADRFARARSGNCWFAHPDSLLIEAAFVSDGFVYTTP